MTARILSRFLLLVAFGTSLTGFCQELANTNNEVLVAGGGFVASDQYPNTHTFWVDANKFPSKVTWEPGRQAFPMDLWAQAVRAKSFLVERNHITNRLDLEAVTIQHGAVTYPHITAETVGGQKLDREWTVQMDFCEWRNNPDLDFPTTVVMLLDGSYATEKVRPKTFYDYETPKHIGEPPRSYAVESGSNIYRWTQWTLKTTNIVYLSIDDTNLEVPKVQWDPNNSALPVDLSGESARMHDLLVQSNRMPEDFELTEILISHRIPGALTGKSGPIDSFWHWVLAFKFEPRPGSRSVDQFTIATLLDGRILNVVVPER